MFKKILLILIVSVSFSFAERIETEDITYNGVIDIVSNLIIGGSTFPMAPTEGDSLFYDGTNWVATKVLFAFGSTWGQPTNLPPWNLVMSPVNTWHSFTVTNFECKAEGGTMEMDLIVQNRENDTRDYTIVWTNTECSTTYSNLLLNIPIAIGDRFGFTCTNMTGVGSNLWFSFGCQLP